MNKPKVFYAYSNNLDDTMATYNKICDYAEKNNCQFEIIDVDYGSGNMLLHKIKEHIDDSDIFVCDITPDMILDNDISLPNPNVMFELGLANNNPKFIKCNIILLLNTKYTKKVPSLLEGFYRIEYDSNDEDYIHIIIDKIDQNIKDNKIVKTIHNNWTTVQCHLNKKILNIIDGLLDVTMTDYVFRLNKKHRQFVILLNCNGGDSRIINIMKKTLTIKKKVIDLSFYDDLYEELKHLEIVAYTSLF